MARMPHSGASKTKNTGSDCSGAKPFQRSPLFRILPGLRLRMPRGGELALPSPRAASEVVDLLISAIIDCTFPFTYDLSVCTPCRTALPAGSRCVAGGLPWLGLGTGAVAHGAAGVRCICDSVP